MTDGQWASLSWNKAPIWGLRPDFYYWQTVACFLMWGALSDERTGLSFTIAAGPRQRCHSRVRVPCDSWPYFTVSDSRLPFSPSPTTRRATVKVFDPASTRDGRWRNSFGRSRCQETASGVCNRLRTLVFACHWCVRCNSMWYIQTAYKPFTNPYPVYKSHTTLDSDNNNNVLYSHVPINS
jgi:hypothetical protein